MNWDALGAMAELISGIGVIATLIYLAIQIKQNTAAQLLDARSLEIEQFNNIRGIRAQSSELSEIWIKGCSGTDITAIEAKRFEDLCLNEIMVVMGTHERSIVMGRKETAQAIVSHFVTDLSKNPGMLDCWGGIKNFLHSGGLQSFVEAVEVELLNSKE